MAAVLRFYLNSFPFISDILRTICSFIIYGVMTVGMLRGRISFANDRRWSCKDCQDEKWKII